MKERLKIRSRVTLGSVLATNCDPVNFIPVYYFTTCKGIQDSLRFWIPRRGFRIPVTGFQSLSVELGPGFWILQANLPNSGFLKEKFPRFWNPDSLKLSDLLIDNYTTFLG